MRKRLRKKLRRGEFRLWCFEINFRFAETISDAERDACVDRFIEWIEARQLQFGGGGIRDWAGIVEPSNRGQLTSSDRLATLDWLQAQREVAHAEAGELRDAWYGWS